MNTYFLITRDGIYRKDVENNLLKSWEQIPMNLATRSDQIIQMTKYGRGKTIKNRYGNGRTQYFTKNEMVLLSLQAEVL